jgi:glycosyltransferase involved in cell wall biosynthesis
MTTIGVGMIARDELIVIVRAIESLKGVVDEIVVVDTGSSDRTREFARDAGARVEEFPWCDDFSAARNYAFSKVRSDWVMCLDADEIFSCNPAEFRAEVAALPETVTVGMIQVRYQNTDFAFNSARLSRKDQGMWVGKCHEYLFSKTGIRQVLKTAEIVHAKPAERRENGTERNIRILTKTLGEHPDDARSLFYLGREYKEKGLYREAISVLERYLPLSTWPSEKCRAHLDLCDCYGHLGEYVPAQGAALDAIKTNDKVLEAYQRLAWIAYMRQDWKMCENWGILSVNLPENKEPVLFETVNMFPTYDYLAISCWNTGNFKVGEKYARKAKYLAPTNPRVANNLAIYEKAAV